MKNVIRFFGVWGISLLLCSFAESPALPMGGAYLVFAEKTGGEITAKQIATQRELKVDGCARGSRIFSFTMEITHNGKTLTYSSDSNALTTTMIATLKSLKAGDYFEFKKTKAYLPNGKEVVEVHSRKFVVV